MSLSIGSGSSSVSSASRELEADITPPPAPEVLPQPITPIVDLTTSGFDDVTRPITCAGPSSSTFDTTPITCAGPATTATPPPVSGPEAAEWPGGSPAAREKSRIEQTALEVPASEKLETLVSALPADVGAEVAKLVNTPPGVTAESLDASYRSVLDARATPGSKQLELSLTPLLSQTTNIGEGETVTSLVAGDAKTFTAALEVGADGKVNGKTLGVDELARLGSQLSTVPVEVKEKALLDAGLSADWVRNSTEGQRDYALAKLRQESATPGSRELDLSFSYTVRQGGDAEYTTTHTAPGVLKLDVGADGTVNGKTPLVEVALATQLTMERMSMADKRAMLAQVGFPPEACSAIRPDEAASILTQVSFATREPGEHSLFVKVDGEAWQLGLKIGEKGAIEGAGAQKVPPDPPFWKQIVGPVLMVVGVVFPVLAPFTMALNAAMAVANGAKGLGLVAAIAGAAAGIGGMVSQFAGVASSVGQSATAFVSVAKTVASVASAANGVQQAIKTGDILGGISSVASLAGQFDGVRDALGSSLDLLQKAGQAAGYASRIVQGDFAGIGADLIAAGIGSTQADVRRVDNDIDASNEPAPGTETDFGVGTARFGESGSSTVRLGTGDDGGAVTPSGPTATQSDVRRIDNELAAAAPQTRADFDRAFAGARRSGETTFAFDMNDGRGEQQYSTGTRQDIAGALPGGSSAQYQQVVQRYFGGHDSDMALAAYRQALSPTPSNGTTSETTSSTSPTGTAATTSPPASSTSDRSSVGRQVADFLDSVTSGGRGLNFFKLLDSAATGLEHPATRDPNMFVVTGHGNQQFVADDRPISNLVNSVFNPGASTEVRAEDLAARILNSNWNGQSVVLLACNTGTGGQSAYAQKLSDLLGVPVAAGDGYVGSDRTGSYVTTNLGPGGSLDPNATPRDLTWFKPRAPGFAHGGN